MTEDPSTVCERHGAAILRRCLGILRDRQAAEDATQDVFLAVLTKGARFRGEAELTTWLYRVTTNHCLNRLRTDRRRAQREDADGVRAWADVAPRDPYELYATKRQVMTLLTGFDRVDQEIFVYRFLDGLTQDEIAHLTGLSRKTVGIRLQRIQAHVDHHIGVAS